MKVVRTTQPPAPGLDGREEGDESRRWECRRNGRNHQEPVTEKPLPRGSARPGERAGP